MGTIALGLVVGQVIEATGWTRRLAVLARPLFRFGHLGEPLRRGLHGRLRLRGRGQRHAAGVLRGGENQPAAALLANFANQLPAFFLHLPTTFFTVIALTGRAGAWYFALTLAAALGRTFLLLLYGRFRLPPEADTAPDAAAGGARPGGRLGALAQRSGPAARGDHPDRGLGGADLHGRIRAEPAGRLPPAAGLADAARRDCGRAGRVTLARGAGVHGGVHHRLRHGRCAPGRRDARRAPDGAGAAGRQRARLPAARAAPPAAALRRHLRAPHRGPDPGARTGAQGAEPGRGGGGVLLGLD
ncbi:MAG: hypothetical protein MZV70_06565 [Desulfobacterales bacterium]|nr:hypothetical protein [Desulfobacterales bacterium]